MILYEYDIDMIENGENDFFFLDDGLINPKRGSSEIVMLLWCYGFIFSIFRALEEIGAC